MDGFERITGREHDGLVEKCQENGWLKVGGFDWQDDPFLEEYPYEFSRTDSVDRLREALGSGNWAIRQGFCYRDLAFIQQVNGGDEWWTLKRDGDAWTGFESWSFGAIAQEPERFERAMRDDGRGHHVEVLPGGVRDLLHGRAAVEQLDRGAPLGGGLVVEAEEVGGRRLRVEVDEQGPKAPGGEDRRQVHGGRRLADAALVVGNGNRAHGSRPL